MIDILNLAVPYFGLIFIGFACGKAKACRKPGSPGLALAGLGAKAAAPTALIFCCDSIFLFTAVPLLIELCGRDHPSLLHALGVVLRQIVLNPLIMSACAGALAAALHIHLPVAIDNTLLFLQNARRRRPCSCWA